MIESNKLLIAENIDLQNEIIGFNRRISENLIYSRIDIPLNIFIFHQIVHIFRGLIMTMIENNNSSHKDYFLV